MKTPIDNLSPGATLALINGAADFVMADLWAIKLNGGAVTYWHGAGITPPLAFQTKQYLAGPTITRGKMSSKLGVEVPTLEATFAASASDMINGVPVIQFAAQRGFDGATVVLYRGLLAAWGQPITGAVVEFAGRVTAIKDVSRQKFTLTFSAWTVLLNVNMGPDVYQAGCLNQHYDANCGLTASPVSGTILAGATQTAFGTSLTNPNGFFTKGTILFTSGANAGLQRAVASYVNAGGAMTVAFPLPYAPAGGDTFTAVRGCMLTMADCTAQANLINFRGQPFTPAAITGAGV